MHYTSYDFLFSGGRSVTCAVSCRLCLQDLALAEGALPRHLHTALFTQSADGRLLTHRQLSRQLITLWCTGHQTAADLLARTVVSYPSGMVRF